MEIDCSLPIFGGHRKKHGKCCVIKYLWFSSFYGKMEGLFRGWTVCGGKVGLTMAFLSDGHTNTHILTKENTDGRRSLGGRPKYLKLFFYIAPQWSWLKEAFRFIWLYQFQFFYSLSLAGFDIWIMALAGILSMAVFRTEWLMESGRGRLGGIICRAILGTVLFQFRWKQRERQILTLFFVWLEELWPIRADLLGSF